MTIYTKNWGGMTPAYAYASEATLPCFGCHRNNWAFLLSSDSEWNLGVTGSESELAFCADLTKRLPHN